MWYRPQEEQEHPRKKRSHKTCKKNGVSESEDQSNKPLLSDGGGESQTITAGLERGAEDACCVVASSSKAKHSSKVKKKKRVKQDGASSELADSAADPGSTEKSVKKRKKKNRKMKNVSSSAAEKLSRSRLKSYGL